MKKRIRLLLVICLLASLFATTTNVQAKGKPYISAQSIVLTRGKSTTLSVKNVTGRVSWSTSDSSVATVTKKGKVKAVKAGNATITAKVGNKKYKCEVSVSNKNTKTLIVYFSTTGTTRAVARNIQKLTGGTLVQLKPRSKYTSNYDMLLNIAQTELEENARPALATTIKNWSQYDTVILGYPIWWGEEPMMIRSFLEKQDWTGKTLLPFCTSGGSGIAESMPNIRRSAEGAIVLAGRDLTDAGTSSIRKWLRNRNVIK